MTDKNPTPAPVPAPDPTPAPAADGLDTIKAFYDAELKRLQTEIDAGKTREAEKDAIINQFLTGAQSNSKPVQINTDPVQGAVEILKERYKQK